MSDETQAPEPTPSAANGDTAATPLARFCQKCQKDVTPIGKGQCPQCGIFLAGSFAARRHPVRLARRAQILAELVAQFPAADIVEQTEREQLAATLERLETTTPGCPAWQRLMAGATSLGAAIRAEAPRTSALSPADLSDLSNDELLARSRQTTARLEKLVALPDSDADAPAGELVRGGAIASQADVSPEPPADAPETQTSPVSPLPRLPSVALPPEPKCQYCSLPVTDCESLRTRNLPTWRVCHGNDPAEIKRRDEEATAIMHHQIGRPKPWR